MRHLLISLSLVLTQVAVSQGEGQFFVGLLNYKTPEGTVCCDNVIANETCTPFCNLMFEVSIHGLQGTEETLMYNLSNTPMTPAQASDIKLDSNSNINNAMSFGFVKWLGSVNVSVLVFDQSNVTDPGSVVQLEEFSHTFVGSVNVSVLVFDQSNLTDPGSVVQLEEFSHTFVYYKPRDFFIQKVLKKSDADPALTILFRYHCNPTKGPLCFGDCVDHGDSEPCPATSPSPLTPEITWTAPICETVGENGQVIHNASCTVESSTPKPTQNSTHTKYLDSGPTEAPTSKSSSGSSAEMTSDVPTTSTSTSSETSPTTTTTTITTTSSTTSSTTSKPTPTTSTSTTLKRSDDPRATVTSDPTRGSTPDERAEKKDEEETMKYWPAIVGGVLGGVAFIAAIGFCLYYRRQKKMRKRQEIYNVNPKVLRNFEEYAENGTSGRADVPLETEQY